MKFSLTKGARYRASFKLSFIEAAVGNVNIKRELEKKGFTDVVVWGTKYVRYAEATWDRRDQVVDLPRQVHEIITVQPKVKEPPPPPLSPPAPEKKPMPKPKSKRPAWWKIW